MSKNQPTDSDWWRGAVIYQIYPRSFADGNNDGVGDFKGITEKLDYVASLGVDGVWLSPFYKSPMADFGYDVSDYCDIDPLFGTMADFDAFLKGAHERGLKIIIDLVLSHTSNQHPWFVESRSNRNNTKADWYVWADPKEDGSPPNNWQSVFGGSSWQYETRRGQYYLHNFLKEQPDLNVRNPQVQEALLDAARFWLDKGVDGFRLDAVNFCIHDEKLRDNPPAPRHESESNFLFHPYSMQDHLFDKSQPETLDFLRRLRRLTNQYGARVMVGEIGEKTHKLSAQYTATPDLLHTAYSFALLDKPYSAQRFRDVILDFSSQPGDGWPSWAFSNHDVMRTATRWGGERPDPAQVKMLIALLCCLPGMIFIYQGEELGLTEADLSFENLKDPYGIYGWPEFKGRDGCRTPMPWDDKKPNAGFSETQPWLPVPDEHRKQAVCAQESDKNSILNFTRHFLGWRKQHQSLIKSEAEFIDHAEPVLVFRRGDVICGFNLKEVPAPLALPACTPLEGHGLPTSASTLPPFGVFLGKQKR